MTPLFLFLLVCAAVYFGTVQAAFSALMRLSLRLVAERNGRGDDLGKYLDDPLLLFVPVRIWLALDLILATLVLASVVGIGAPHAVGLLILLVSVLGVVFEHFLPFLIVRRDPEAVLDALLPSFTLFARILQPITLALVRVVLPRRSPVAAAPAETTGDTDEATTGSTKG
jgi:Mg2+/Co2+ transporter CorB